MLGFLALMVKENNLEVLTFSVLEIKHNDSAVPHVVE